MKSKYEEGRTSAETSRNNLASPPDNVYELDQRSGTTLTPLSKPRRGAAGSPDDITDTTCFNTTSTTTANTSDNNTYMSSMDAIPENRTTVGLEDDNVVSAVANKTKYPKMVPVNNAKNSSTSGPQTRLNNDCIEYAIVDKRNPSAMTDNAPKKPDANALQPQLDAAYDDVEYAVSNKIKSQKHNTTTIASQLKIADAYGDVEYAVVNKMKSPNWNPTKGALQLKIDDACDDVEYAVCSKMMSQRRNPTAIASPLKIDDAYDDVEYAMSSNTKYPKKNPNTSIVQPTDDAAYDDVEYAAVDKTKPSAENVYEVAEPVRGTAEGGVEEVYELTESYR